MANFTMIITFLLLFLLQILSTIGSLPYIINFNSSNFDAFPNPQSANFSKCRIPKQGFLCDPENILVNDYMREQMFELIESFPNKTGNPFGKTECERQGVHIGIGLSRDFWNVTRISSDLSAAALADKWFQLETGISPDPRTRTKNKKWNYTQDKILGSKPKNFLGQEFLGHIMVMVTRLQPNYVGIYCTPNLPISVHQIAALRKNAIEKMNEGPMFEWAAMAAMIEGFQHIIQLDIHSQNLHILLEQPKPFVVSVWLSIGIAICCSIVVSALMLALYWAFFGRKKRSFDGPIPMSQLSRMELEGQSHSYHATTSFVEA